MADSFQPDLSRQLVSDLCALVSDRAPADTQIVAEFRAAQADAEKAYQAFQQGAAQRHQTERAAMSDEYASLRTRIAEKFDQENRALQQKYDAAREEIASRFEAGQTAAQQQLQDARWEATTIAEAAKGGSGLQLKEIQTQLDARWNELQTIRTRAIELLQHRNQWRELPDPQVAFITLETHPMRRFIQAVEQAQRQYRALAAQRIPRLFEGLRPFGAALLVWAVLIYPSGALLGWGTWYWAAASSGIAIVLLAALGGWLYSVARRQSADAWLALRRIFLEAGLDHPATLETSKADCHRLFAAVVTRHNAEVKKADEAYAAAMSDLQKRRQHDLQRNEAVYPPRLAAIAVERERALAELDSKYPRMLRDLDEAYQAELDRARKDHAEATLRRQQRFEMDWSALADRWQTGLRRFTRSIDCMRQESDRRFPDWNSDDWSRWTLPDEIPPAVRFADGEVQLSRIPSGIPADRRLQPETADFSLPLLLPFPRQSLLLLKSAGEGRTESIRAIGAVMLRMLTALPPGKVRFTIFDPVGLGENFSAFMHLADYDDQLIASRIWTDTAHIEQRLSDMTEHMENVIQVYLRNEFDSIEQYNAHAGEMAEPYRVLVVADFPANISEAAAQRLKSVVASGARCGVFVLMSVDTRVPLPRHFHLSDLENDAMTLEFHGGRFDWVHPDYGPVPVRLIDSPPAERFTEIVRAVGQEVKRSSRVEVPFEHIAPTEAERWTADSSAGIDVPLGRAGAMKLQHLELGKGTSQHVLISGKTGSGKSTLLHVLITNLALRYSPAEVELYLVDFKKGVEFKAYARYGLPHARVVAIESEREFGMSVLEHLDSELRRRGDLFRGLGVQDLKGYRAADGGGPMPRILLIIDEFQELFVEDDRVSQEAALLLDRLVRQGRAFGIHVLLGSQTLGGAYSLARSTIGQMAVRIALQCSESDAHLILSEENTAARLLTRPGEAIYNDANGLYEGNHPFQIVWLSDELRDSCLEQIGHMAVERKCTTPPAIVFEGNQLAAPGDNPHLAELLAAPAWPQEAAAPEVWLGSAVAIAPATAAAFQRQSGNNLLMVGHREEAALGIMAAGLISLAAQLPPCPAPASDRVRFYVLDGTRPDAPEVGFWPRLLQAVPHANRLGGPREMPELLAELAQEVAARQDEGRENAAPIYLFIYNLSRFRELRKEDDYSFGGDDDKPASPAKQLAAILRDGPSLGIHTLLWCDSYSTVSRLLDRQNLRDLEMRVLFQMNATDSANLMDTPEAGRLGVHRALFYDEAQGRTEKFRPYGLPSDEWLSWVRQQLHSREPGCPA